MQEIESMNVSVEVTRDGNMVLSQYVDKQQRVAQYLGTAWVVVAGHHSSLQSLTLIMMTYKQVKIGVVSIWSNEFARGITPFIAVAHACCKTYIALSAETKKYTRAAARGMDRMGKCKVVFTLGQTFCIFNTIDGEKEV